MYAQVIDANINRISEGLRVIEEYTRFILSDVDLTKSLSEMRKQVNASESNPAKNMSIRNTAKDVRSQETPQKRPSIAALLKANFKRVQEGLRVLEEYSSNPLYNRLRYRSYELEKEILLPLLKPKITQGVYIISHDPDILIQGIQWGVAMIQLRAKGESKESILNKAQRIKAYSQTVETPFIINDYLDIAMIVDADGIHTGQDDMSVTELKKLWGEHKLYGRTTHSLEQGKTAEKQGADYASIGPIWETPSKPGRAGIGFDYLSKKSELSIPVVAIGGINNSNISEIVAFKPDLVGVIRDYQHAKTWQALFKNVIQTK